MKRAFIIGILFSFLFTLNSMSIVEGPDSPIDNITKCDVL